MKKQKRVKKKRIAKENSKGKTVVHSERYWEDIELEKWEQEQIKIAYRYYKHNKKKLKRRASQLSFSLPYLEDLPEDLFKGLDVEHLRDKNGVVKYWGADYNAPKPIRYPNGGISAEDIILNPGPAKRDIPYPTPPRIKANAKMLIKLMARLGITDKRIRISDDAKSEEQENKGDWILSDSKNGSRRFDAKKQAIKSADQRYSLLTNTSSNAEYNFKRYRIKIKKVDGKRKKFIKLILVSKNIEPGEVKTGYEEKCKGCGNIIPPTIPALVTKWESVNGIMKAKSAWCKNCEYIGHKIAKKRRTKKRKLKKLEKKNESTRASRQNKRRTIQRKY